MPGSEAFFTSFDYLAPGRAQGAARGAAPLQRCNRHGLIVPIDAEHMYYAAINSKGCKLTALGAHYRKLAEMKRL